MRAGESCRGGSRVELATLPGTRKPHGPGTSTVRQLGQVKNRFQSHINFTNKSAFYFPEVYIVEISGQRQVENGHLQSPQTRDGNAQVHECVSEHILWNTRVYLCR